MSTHRTSLPHLAFVVAVLLPALAASGRAGPVTTHLLEKGLAALRQAEAAWHSGEPAAARAHGHAAAELFQDAWGQEPGDGRAALLGGQAAAFADDLRGAARWVERLRQSSRLGEQDPQLHYLLGFVHLVGAQRPDRALVALKRMYSLSPATMAQERDNLWYLALRDQGRLMMEASKYEDAIAQFRAAARLARRMGSRSRELSMLGNTGIALRRADRFIEAGEEFQKLIDAEPADPLWRWHMGLNHATQSRFMDAIPYYRDVIRMLQPGQHPADLHAELLQAHMRLANCLRIVAGHPQNAERRGEILAEAEKLLRHYVQVAPDHALGHKWLGVFLFEAREPPLPYEALPLLHKAFELDPDCEDALGYIIKIHQFHPPPPGHTPSDDPQAAAEALRAWRAPVAGWQQNIEAGIERRRAVRDARVVRTGDGGCD